MFRSLSRPWTVHCRLLSHRRWLSEHRKEGSSIADPLPPIDTTKNVQWLKNEGFTPEQSEAIVGLISEAIQEGMHNVVKSMVTKSEQQQESIQSQNDFEQVSQSIKSLSDKNLSAFKADLAKLKTDVADLELIMKEQVQRVHGNLVLDMNLERGRMREEIKQLEEKLDAVKKSVDSEVSVVVNKVDEIGKDLRQSISQVIAAAFCFFIGYKVFLYANQNKDN